MEGVRKHDLILNELCDSDSLLRVESKKFCLKSMVNSFVIENGPDSLDVPLILMDLAKVVERFELWKRLMPTVEPWYAVKCNPNPTLIRLLRELGCNFDCATPFEIDLVKSLGHPADKIVYAHPTKPVSHLKSAKQSGVKLTVFDNEAELRKIACVHPEAELLIRLAPIDDSKAQCPMSIKFGAPPHRVRPLLELAKDLVLNVIGVHFHVGSGCTDVSAYRGALTEARRVFDLAGECGFSFTLLDIGGGYPGSEEPGQIQFEAIAEEINTLLPVLFPDTRVIAEPGRFFAMAACALVTKVVSKADLGNRMRYHLNDGLYGSFNCLLYDHAELPNPTVVRSVSGESDPAVPCCIFGPTCDGFDRVAEKCLTLPEMQVGDLIIWDKMGAYTSAAATNFNGFATPKYLYYATMNSKGLPTLGLAAFENI